MPVGIGEDVVHAEHAGHSGDDAQHIAVGPVGRQEHIQQEDHRHIGGVLVQVDVPQEQTQHHRRQIQSEGNGQVPAGARQPQAGKSPLPLVLAAELGQIGFPVHAAAPFLYMHGVIVAHPSVKKSLNPC